MKTKEDIIEEFLNTGKCLPENRQIINEFLQSYDDCLDTIHQDGDNDNSQV